MYHLRTLLLLTLAFIPYLALAETTTAETAVPGVTAIGTIDIRPSYTPKSGEFHSEDSVELGAKLSPNVSLSYLQAVFTNLYNPEADDTASGLNAKLDVGFIRTRVSLWADKDQGLSLSYQGRTYLPVDDPTIAKRQVIAQRNYFTLTKKLSDTVSLSISEIPIFFINSQAGVVSASGAAANALFENRVYVMPTITFNEKLSMVFPVMFHQTRYLDFQAGAKNNASWKFFAWINPEITYQATENYSLGLGYYSDNLVASDLSDITLGSGLESGIVQISLAASL